MNYDRLWRLEPRENRVLGSKCGQSGGGAEVAQQCRCCEQGSLVKVEKCCTWEFS